jgi:prepilin-type N-terminal cleavage/methylation domain-containing protein
LRVGSLNVEGIVEHEKHPIKEKVMKRFAQKGFTLVELMVVIVIVGILAAVAIPKMTSAAHKAKASEFPTVLTSYYTHEESVQAETGSYTDDAGLTAAGMTIPSSQWFTYSIPGAVTTSSYTAEASAVAFGNVTAGEKATIDQDNQKSADTNLKNYVPSWK